MGTSFNNPINPKGIMRKGTLSSILSLLAMPLVKDSTSNIFKNSLINCLRALVSSHCFLTEAYFWMARMAI